MQPLFDHPKTRTHQSHADLLEKVLAICDGDEFYQVKIDLIKHLIRKEAKNGNT